MSKSCEQRLITKGHIVMHTNLILLLKVTGYPLINFTGAKLEF